MNNEIPPTRIKRRSKDQRRQASKQAILAAFESALDRAETCDGVIRAKVQIAGKGYCHAEVKFEEAITVKL